jgi:tRNA threonylcarbamoyladenosine biosynthesis protein TsaE
MNMMDITYSRHNIQEVAEQLAAIVADYRVLTFDGDLGAGKTTLIAALCRVWGVVDSVSSPTYSLINQYVAKSLPVGNSIYHLDLYRLKSAAEGIDAGMEDILYSGEYCLVEWPSKAPEIIPGRRLQLSLRVCGHDTRHLTVVSREK